MVRALSGLGPTRASVVRLLATTPRTPGTIPAPAILAPPSYSRMRVGVADSAGKLYPNLGEPDD